jgi:hypothetical protein
MAMEDYNAIDFRTESFVQTARLLIEAGADPSIPSMGSSMASYSNSIFPFSQKCVSIVG